MIRNSLSLGFLCLPFEHNLSISERAKETLEEREAERKGLMLFLCYFMSLLVGFVNPHLKRFSGLRPLSFFSCFFPGLSLPENKV
ncbi:hypothetical protein [Marinomonas spartinae]|uniref:hypothetical protein n=1 Tax=Marinomonas spartinae TaxID=1792290 RepID=UPI0018F26C84|nr:hypothetical protein [Marinomonas spartinae]MBJ7553547.1 hypothetical protein [Marinomonas spartinae]